MIRFAKKGLVEYLESVALAEIGFLIHAFCTRRGGVSKGFFSSLNFSSKEGDAKENVQKNWQIIADAFNINVRNFVSVSQIHGDRIFILNNSADKNQYMESDAIITDQKGVAIGIKTADCIPIFLADIEKRIIGVVHAGWKGTSLQIAAKTVKAFVKNFSSNTNDIVAVIGPAIGHCCYQVDEVVFESSDDEDWRSCFSKCEVNGKWMLDLSLANKYQLLRAGIISESIHSASVCTACSKDLFFSYRAERGMTGRQLNFMMIRESQ